MYTHVDTVTVVVVYITVVIYSYVATMNYFHIDNTFVRLLQCRLKRSDCSSDSAMRDIYDGSLYKGDSEFFSNPNNLSFVMNFDGAPKFKFIINRRSKNYMILAGLWCATAKPPCFSFLELLCNSLAKIQTEGICIVTCSYIANYII